MRSIRVGVAGCWVVLLACGGIVERHVDESTGGSSAAGPSNNPSRSGSSSTSRGGSPQTAGTASTIGGTVSATAGTATGIAGTAVTMPIPDPQPAACFNDTDCPGSACGSQVCNWTLIAPQPVGDKVFACNPAGSQAPGKDGWCTTDENCKCRGAGAKCITPYCTFTR